jgi:hypothetical protein
MRHILLAAVGLALGCGGEAYEYEDELGQIEEAVTARAWYGWTSALSNGPRCNPTSSATCYYPPDRGITIRVDQNSFALPFSNYIQIAVDQAIADFNTGFSSTGFSAVRVFGNPAQFADLVVRNMPNEPEPTPLLWTFPPGIKEVVRMGCLGAGPVMTESPSVPGTHRFCAQANADFRPKNLEILARDFTIVPDLYDPAEVIRHMRHGAGVAIAAAAGLGTQTTDPSKYTYERADTAEGAMPKTQYSTVDVCLAGSYGITSPTTFTRSAFTCL